MLSGKAVGLIEKQLLAALAYETNNVTEAMQTQQRLRTSEIRYRRLFEAARDGILILDAATLEITDVNPFMTELLGYSPEEFLGKELWQIGFFSDKDASQAAFRELQAKGFIRYEDLPLQTTAGKPRQVEFVSNVYEEGGQRVIQCNIRDITDRKRTEQERRLLLASAEEARAEADTANRIKDEFLATVSHELRTPLTAILGWAELLTSGNLDQPTAKRALEIIVRNARAQSQLIDDLLDISRVITGILRLDVQPVELATTIEAIVDGLRPAAESKKISLQITLGAVVNPISGDPDRIQQIVWNLLSNAIKFTPEGGHVEVRLEGVASHVEITISDTGLGIAPELLLNIFDRFRQADSSITRLHGGLGLGLSIVRELVELHDGSVTAESPGAGKGTTFKVVLPLMSVNHELSDAEKPRPMIESRTTAASQPSLKNLRVLVVDDEQDARELVAVVLMGCEAEVVSVASGAEAVAEMMRERFDVLVSDIGMPVMDGYALIEKIRQFPAECGGGTPAAAVTAYAGVEDRMRVLAAGYQMHIPKPVEPTELANVVASLAERYRVPVAV